MVSKFCSKCGYKKPLKCFHRCSRIKCGYISRCKDCQKIYSKNTVRKIEKSATAAIENAGKTVQEKSNTEFMYRRTKSAFHNTGTTGHRRIKTTEESLGLNQEKTTEKSTEKQVTKAR